eukprot:Trichotokara_eunicae@DN2877_c0_g1_i1.p1
MDDKFLFNDHTTGRTIVIAALTSLAQPFRLLFSDSNFGFDDANNNSSTCSLSNVQSNPLLGDEYGHVQMFKNRKTYALTDEGELRMEGKREEENVKCLHYRN